MRTKNLAIALGICFLFGMWGLFARNRKDEEIANQLALQEQRVTAEPSKSDSPPQRRAVGTLELTPSVFAKHEKSSDKWFVTTKGSSTYVKLPFVPPENGARLGGAKRDIASVEVEPGFLGADACQECHQEKHAGFIHTAHYKTSGLMGNGGVHGHFSGPASAMTTTDPDLSFEMFQEGEQYVQRVHLADYSFEVSLDVVTGSSKAGQTFLYWHDDKLYQAFVSYLTDVDEWITSPGYKDTSADYSRRIRAMCLECHVTYIEQTRIADVFKPETAVWGISCERCHGPGRDHVDYHRAHPNERVAKHIVEPSDLPRERQLDICSQCHSGKESLVTGKFDFRPGMQVDRTEKDSDPEADDVGGIHNSNQLNRLSMSQCFQESQMTCTSCHNPHLNQRGKKVSFTASCLICHQPDHCGMSEQLGASVAENCVECHMPMGDIENMTLQVSGGSFTVRMIDHYIRVDRKATQEFLSQ